MTKTRDIIAEIAAKVPRTSNGSRPWWERVADEHREMLDAIHAAWHAGTFGTKKITAARTISATLREFDIIIGEQGVTAWLELPPRS